VQLDRDPPVDLDELALIKRALAHQLRQARNQRVEAPQDGREPRHRFALPEIADLENASVAEAEACSPAQPLVSCMAAVARARLLIVGTDSTLVEVAALLSSQQGSVAVVCDSVRSTVGVITDSMLIHQLGFAGQGIFTARAINVMSREFASCHLTDSLSHVLARMHRQACIHAPVVDADNKPIGVIYARDGLRALLAAGNFEESQLRDYVMGIGYR
jgi:predicted transcriptional regulator